MSDKKTKPSSRSVVNCTEFSSSPVPDLKELDNYMFIECLGQRHLHPQRVKSATVRNVDSLKLTYVSSDHVTYLRKTSANLKRLDLSSCGLFRVPYDIIADMGQLQLLNLDNNQLNDNSFCHEFSQVLGKNLRELSVCSNSLSTIPKEFESFIKVSRLKIGKNGITNLLGIENLKRLKLLIGDNNQLQQLGAGFYQLKSLENVYLSNNQLSNVSIAVKQMTHLREIDLSFNSIKTIPGDLFLLRQLEIIKLHHNKITKIPKFKISGRMKNPISCVDLSHNNICRFPDCVMMVSDELDLCNNKIRTIPQHILKKLSVQTDKTLSLSNNPIVNPPKDAAENGLKSMIKFYQENCTEENNYYGIKIFAMGCEAHKSKIINNLVDQYDDDDVIASDENKIDIIDANLEINTDDHTNGKSISINCQITDITFGDKSIDLLTLMLTKPMLLLLFIDTDKYSDTDKNLDKYFEQFLTVLLKQIIVQHNQINLILIGVTQNENDNQKKGKLNEMKEKIDNYLKSYLKKINDEIKRIESEPEITAAMNQNLKKFINLKSVKIYFHKEVFFVKSSNTKAIIRILKVINKIAKNSKLFPTALNTVPKFWSDVQMYLEEDSYQFPVVTFEEFEFILQQRFNLKAASVKIASFLHETGKIFWWENSMKPLRNWVVTCPQSFIDCLTVFYQKDLKSYLEDPNDVDMKQKRFKKKFTSYKYTYKECCNIFLNESILLPELCLILLENIIPDNAVIRMLYFLTECCGLGYSVPYAKYFQTGWDALLLEVKEHQSDSMTTVSSVEHRIKSADSRKSVEFKTSKIPPIFFHCLLNKPECSNETNEKWNSSIGSLICAGYKFPIGVQRLLCHQIFSNIRNLDNLNVKIMDHWNSGIQGIIEEESIVFRLFFHEDIKVISVTIRSLKNEDADENDEDSDNTLSNLWEFLLKYLMKVDEFLNSNVGLWFERLIKCPFCKEFTFPGTWHAYSENRSGDSEICKMCNNLVPMNYIESPRMSKTISSEQILKNIRKQFSRT